MLPIPPIPRVLAERPDWTVPSPEWEAWARATFIDPRSGLAVPSLACLGPARIGFLLTNAVKTEGGLRWNGAAGAFKPSGDGWAKAQSIQRMMEWFGFVPDFTVTLDVSGPRFRTTRGICFLVEHELKHCGVRRNAEGAMYGKDDRPVWTTVPHAAEINEGDIQRWGVEAVRGGAMVARESRSSPTVTDDMLRSDDERPAGT